MTARLRLVDAGEGARAPSMKDRRIVILGFMGCGKTTAGQKLARELNCNFVDLDSFIAEREGRSPAHIIKADGELVFREIEAAALRDVLEEKNARVIALGGGAWTIEANRTMVAEHGCVSIWLDAPFELCWERITSSRTARPLAPNRVVAESLYDSRRLTYSLAHKHVLVKYNQVVELSDEIESEAN